MIYSVTYAGTNSYGILSWDLNILDTLYYK